jgi:Vault protein inter-alpha-trypsin domain
MAAASIDPRAHFFGAILWRGDRKPVPLTSTQIDVTIRGGLASVTTQRTFRNTETQSIEATMTFPVPVDATLCELTANIDGRVLHAVARAREKASKAYEAAIKSGKSAILHQDLRRSRAPRRRNRRHRHLDGTAVVPRRNATAAHPDHGRRNLRTISLRAALCTRPRWPLSAATELHRCCRLAE